MKQWLVGLLLLCTFSINTFSQEASHITKEQAIEIAKRELIALGLKNEEWLGGEVSTHFNGKTWMVILDAKPSSERYIPAQEYIYFIISSDGRDIKYGFGL